MELSVIRKRLHEEEGISSTLIVIRLRPLH